MRTVAVVSLGLALPSSSRNKGTTTSERTNTVSETACIYDGVLGSKLASHRLEGASAGLTANSRAIITTRSGKSTTAVFSWGRESPTSRFAAPEQLGPITFTHDGLHIVAGGISGSVYVWEACTGQLLCAWKAHYRKVLALQFTDDDSVLVSSGDDAMVHLWDFASALGNNSVPERSLVRTVSTNKTGVTGLACGVGGVSSKIATSSLDHSCRVFNASSGVETFCATFPSALLCVLLDLGETQVFAGGSDGSVHIGELATGKTYSLSGHEAAVTCLASVLTPQSFLVISGSDDGTLKWWDTQSKSSLKTVRTEGNCPVRGICMVDVEKSSSNTKQVTQQPSLKKLKEDDSEDRWVVCVGESEWEREQRLKSTAASVVVVAAKSSTTTADGESEKLLSIANRLYTIAAEGTLSKVKGGSASS